MTQASLLPPNATALERAVSALGLDVRNIPVPLRTLHDPYQCPAKLLPWLAYQVAVDEWDEAWTTQVKRDVIAQSIPLKRIKGTYGAVQRAVSALGITATVQEWYQQAPVGAPYTFRLNIEADQVGYDQRQLSRIVGVVDQAKNLRSHLTGMSLSMRSTSGLRKASAPMAGQELTVQDGTPRYDDGISALDLLVDGAVNGYDATGDAVDDLNEILLSMPTRLSIPADL